MTAYLVTTFLIFAFGPVDWPVDNWGRLLLFLSAVLGALVIGYRLGVDGPPAGTELKAWRAVFLLGAISNIVLLFPAAHLYTGKMPWEVLDALRDQGQAYREFQQTLGLTTHGDRAAVAIVRTIVSPLTLAVLPLGILHWRRLSWSLRLLLVASVFSMIILSLLRGTDRETADLIIVFSSTFLVAVMRNKVRRGISLLAELKRRQFAVLVTTVVVATAAVLFLERKEQRVGSTHEICAGESQICANYDYPLFGSLDDPTKFALSMTSLYVAQGYYGLSLALSKDFQSTWGLGHSFALMNYYSALVGNEDLYQRSYTFRLRDDGWSDLHQWSTMFPWFANDVGFVAVPFVIGLLAWIWGKSWKDAVFRSNDRAAIVFTFMMLMMFYMPANNQLTQTVDVYLALVTWILIWLVDRRSFRRQGPVMIRSRCRRQMKGSLD